MVAICKSFLQNLSPLPTSLKVEPLAKPKTSLKLFVNTTKPKTKVLAVFGQKLETKALAKIFHEYGPRIKYFNFYQMTEKLYLLKMNFP